MKKRMLCSIVSLLLVTLLVLSCCVGCTSDEPDVGGATTTTTETLELSDVTTDDGATTTEAQQGDNKTSADGKKTTTTKSGPTTTVQGVNAGDSVDSNAAVGGTSDIAMPTANLKNKTVTVFSWRDQLTNASVSAGTKPDVAAVYKKAGLTIKTVLTTHAQYWDHLSSLVAADTAPDLMEPNSAKFYPTAITSNLVVPMEEYIDLDKPLWDDYRDLSEQYMINGKMYFAVEYLQIDEFIYYNPKLFKSMGLKTPREYWEEGNWTMETLQMLADKLVVKDKEGTVTRIGFAAGADIGAITGVELVQYSRTNGYKLNITNSKFSKLMGYFYNMGTSGTKSAGFAAATAVATGKAAIGMTKAWAHTAEMNDARLKGELEWVILPKLDKNSKHYYNVTLQPTFGIMKGATNPEGAAYMVELRRWAFLDYPWVESLPFTGTNYVKTFGEKKAADMETTAEAAYTKKMLTKGYDVIVSNMWQSWLATQQFPGITQVVSNGNKWSTVVANQAPVLEATLKSYKFK